jgi:hypothetical protein
VPLRIGANVMTQTVLTMMLTQTRARSVKMAMTRNIKVQRHTVRRTPHTARLFGSGSPSQVW